MKKQKLYLVTNNEGLFGNEYVMASDFNEAAQKVIDAEQASRTKFQEDNPDREAPSFVVQPTNIKLLTDRVL